MSADVREIDWFATRDEDSYRDEARNILDSYAHPWDLLVELAQNAVDAIEHRASSEIGGYRGSIDITIDSGLRSIVFVDNGIGISEADLGGVLRPHFSRKRGNNRLKGEKGVGLTYIALMGNQLDILTRTKDDAARILRVEGAQDWMNRVASRPKLKIEPLTADAHPNETSYTEVRLSKIASATAEEDASDIFTFGIKQLVHLLRSRTAVGFTGHLYNISPRVEIKVSLAVGSTTTGFEKTDVPFAYASPKEYLDSRSTIDLEKVRQYLSQNDSKRASGKPIFYSNIYSSKGGKDVRAFAFVAPRATYAAINADLKQSHDDLSVQGGIYIATKGMPTGIALTAPKTGKAQYWPNVFILLEYDGITLDLGRKSLTAPRVVEMLKKQAAVVFNLLESYFKLAMRDDEGTLQALVSQAELHDELVQVKLLESMSYVDSRAGDSVSDTYPFIREPQQEQDVLALFSMALARGVFPYQLLRVSSSYRYDCFLALDVGKKRHTIVGEFKYAGESIARDLEDAKARYGELQLLICWELDEKALKKKGFHVSEVTVKKNELPGATHKIAFPNASGIKDQPIAVICLKRHITPRKT